MKKQIENLKKEEYLSFGRIISQAISCIFIGIYEIFLAPCPTISCPEEKEDKTPLEERKRLGKMSCITDLILIPMGYILLVVVTAKNNPNLKQCLIIFALSLNLYVSGFTGIILVYFVRHFKEIKRKSKDFFSFVLSYVVVVTVFIVVSMVLVIFVSNFSVLYK